VVNAVTQLLDNCDDMRAMKWCIILVPHDEIFDGPRHFPFGPLLGPASFFRNFIQSRSNLSLGLRFYIARNFEIYAAGSQLSGE
jgi:hypothetical protein